MIQEKPSDAVMKEARKVMEAALYSPSQFDLMLMQACNADFITCDGANILAHAALMLCNVPEFQSAEPWLRERAAILFCRAFDAVALEREARAAVEAGRVH